MIRTISKVTAYCVVVPFVLILIAVCVVLLFLSGGMDSKGGFQR